MKILAIFLTKFLPFGAAAFCVPGIVSGAFVNVNAQVDGGCSFSSTSTSQISNSCSGAFIPNGGLYTILGSTLTATATYSSLKAYAFQDVLITANIYNSAVTSHAISTAFFDDNIALPAFYRQPAYVTFGWTAKGTGYGQLTMFWGANCVQNIISTTAGCTLTQKLQPGLKYQLETILSANATVSFSGSQGNELSQTSDFSHTAQLNKVELFDLNMNPLTGVHLVSDSGFDYQNNVSSAVPEPTSVFLLLSGLIGTAMLFYSRSKA